MKKFISYVIVMLIIISFPIIANANIICNDGTVSKSCNDCHQGCCSKHGGCSSGGSNSGSSGSGSTGSSSNKKPPVTITEPKNDDTSLKEVKIDDEKIEILSNMVYTTLKENVIINVIANDSKAKIEYNKNPELVIGENLIDIKVTAESGKTQTYKINITREKILSDNKNIKIFVNDEEVIFYSFRSDVINLSYDKSELNIQYELEDEFAKAEIIGNESLVAGANEILVKVTAENGEEDIYTIVVNKKELEEKNVYEDKVNIDNQIIQDKEEDFNFFSYIASVCFLGGVGYLIYYFAKKKNSKSL